VIQTVPRVMFLSSGLQFAQNSKENRHNDGHIRENPTCVTCRSRGKDDGENAPNLYRINKLTEDGYPSLQICRAISQIRYHFLTRTSREHNALHICIMCHLRYPSSEGLFILRLLHNAKIRDYCYRQ
jgi:hypothetical protein